MTVSGGRADHWASDSSGVRNSPRGPTDHAVALSRIGENFEITGRHAEGATCEVFKGHHVALDVGIAIKILKPEYAADPAFLERMRIEAQVLPRLRSPHIVRCFDRGMTEDGRPFTVLEFLRGETLETLLSKLKSFDELTTIELGLELLEALATTHAQGVVHRDVSLHNLIVHRPEHEPATLKLIDFGFAWILPNAPECAPEPTSSPERGVAVGTPRFASPEVAKGRTDIDGRSDLYSAGVILYSMLAGRDPFAELRSPTAVLNAHTSRPPPPISRFAPHVSPELASVITRLLEKAPAARFSSAAEAARALMEAGEVTRSRALKRHTVPPPATIRPRLALGERCGPYVITRLIDAAGFSEVYEAEPAENTLKRRVALKILKRDFKANPDARKRFLDEARELATIRHPNVVTVHKAGDHEGSPWLSMELVAGVTLRQHLDRERALPPARAIKFAYGIAHALRQLHRLDMIHGCLTPERVLVTPNDETCLIPAGPTSTVDDAETRASSDLLGTLAYASPEALMAHALDARSDLYSWGLVFFEMLTGHHAHGLSAPRRGPAVDRILSQLHDPIPQRKDVAPHLPKRLWSLLEAVTEKCAAFRPAGVPDVCVALDDASEGLVNVRPLALTSEYGIAVNGSVLVLLWHAPPSARNVSQVRNAVRLFNVALSAVLVVIGNAGAAPNTSARLELAELGDALASRVALMAIVSEERASVGTGVRAVLSQAGFLPPEALPHAIFSSAETAAEWLARHQVGITGISDTTAVLAELRRRMRSATNVQGHPLAEPEKPSAIERSSGTPRRTLTICEQGDLIVVRENEATPSDEEWDEFLAVVVKSRDRSSAVKFLVITDGGGPNAEQRKRLRVALDGHSFRVAVVTDSSKVRFVVSSVALLNPDISTFSHADIARACEYLGVDSEKGPQPSPHR